MYPRLSINLKKFEENVAAVAKLVKDDSGCTTLALVTKGHSADPELVKVIVNNPKVDFVADSRLINLRNYFSALGDGNEEAGRKAFYDAGKKTLLLRIPMQSELSEVVKLVDLCQISEIETIKLLDNEAGAIGKVQDILLMIDMGDLREGIFFRNKEDIHSAVSEILELKNINLKGISVNLTCYGAIIPKEDNLSEFVGIAREIEERHGVKLDIVSGGNSSSVYLAEEGRLPEGITNLRIGEAHLQGTEAAYGNRVKGTNDDVFILEAEIVELKTKPSLPIGESGVDAFGHVPHYEDKGDMKRAIIAVGKQDIELDSMTPLDEKIEIMGGSSDHIILDVTHSETAYKVGDIVKFRLGYSGMLRATTSKYVDRVYVK